MAHFFQMFLPSVCIMNKPNFLLVTKYVLLFLLEFCNTPSL